ncbi:hypothetical protein ES708_13320 [subsurface metagenome]
MSFSTERAFTVQAFSQKLLGRSDRRYSWDITNDSGATIWYMRGPRGRDMAIAGEAVGIPIVTTAADGYDEEDAIAEVWVIAAAPAIIVIGETKIPVPWPEYRYGSGSGRRPTGRRV